ncbi:hypothetical protein GCM10010389_33950 [Streptomyces echinoruber]|uniref:Uncharacterized protein n=1 Tax=Streptomyces echinoruber TaxID=68898 RepID=A0A918RAY7_9ACTN|nr:hypothetical protein GCM10010389_33950 [Streptomyces echinoruber]
MAGAGPPDTHHHPGHTPRPERAGRLGRVAHSGRTPLNPAAPGRLVRLHPQRLCRHRTAWPDCRLSSALAYGGRSRVPPFGPWTRLPARRPGRNRRAGRSLRRRPVLSDPGRAPPHRGAPADG